MSDGPSPGLVDWSIAFRLGKRIAGNGEPHLDEAAVRATCAEALGKALAYTTLEPASPVPEVEVVARDEWITTNIAELSALVVPMEERFAGELDLPGPFGPMARKALGAAAGAEAGAVVGYAAKRVLGQYVVSLGAEPREPRMLLVGANLEAAAAKLAVDPEAFLLWVSIHEQTHSIQFGAVPWLRDHLAGLVSELMNVASNGINIREVLARAKDLVTPDPRAGLRRIFAGELTRILASPEQAAIMDRMQASMAVLEGYAEHVMDEASAGEPELELMRERMDARRAHRAGVADTIARFLGLGQKLRQYELGKQWCDAVAAETGIDGLDRVWESPEALPSLEELEDPNAWINRILAPAAA
ncbi:MAG TPA: zinc-dependent metalloprotease [Solirubrobacterales bacterium]|nr:zinc-dependent metalloprotease [Solirubrobacterales bacterium]